MSNYPEIPVPTLASYSKVQRVFALARLLGPARKNFEQAALARKGWSEALVWNLNLSPEAWDELYRRSSASARAVLASRPLGPEQIDRVSCAPVASRAAEKALASGPLLSRAQFLAFAETGSRAAARTLFDRMLWPVDGDGAPPVDSTSRDLAVKLAKLAGPGRNLALLANHRHLFTLEEVLAALYEAADADLRSRSAGLWVQRILADDAEVRAAIASGRRTAWLDSRLAGSATLRSVTDQFALAGLPPVRSGEKPDVSARKVLSDRQYVLLALVNNPACDVSVVSEVVERVEALAADGYLEAADKVLSSAKQRLARRPTVSETYDKVSDVDLLGWLVNRATTGEFNTYPRLFDLLELAGNPALTADQADRICNDLLTSQETLRTVGRSQARATLHKLRPVAQWDDLRFSHLIDVFDRGDLNEPKFGQISADSFTLPDEYADRRVESVVQTLEAFLYLPYPTSEPTSLDWAISRLMADGDAAGDRLEAFCTLAYSFSPTSSVGDLVETALAF